MASDLLPPGRLTLAASHIYAREAPKATSLVLYILKCQVSMAGPVGRLAGLVTSDALRMTTVASLALAAFNRLFSFAVSTSWGFCSSPEPATIISLGTVTL